MKPDAPAEIRGEFKPIGDSCARHSDLRASAEAGRTHEALGAGPSLSHRENGHLPATHRLLTGAPMPNQRVTDLDNVLSRRDWPCYAAGLDYVRPRHDGVPSGVTLPHCTDRGAVDLAGPARAASWAALHDPLLVTQDPNVADLPHGHVQPAGGHRSAADGERAVNCSTGWHRLQR